MRTLPFACLGAVLLSFASMACSAAPPVQKSACGRLACEDEDASDEGSRTNRTTSAGEDEGDEASGASTAPPSTTTTTPPPTTTTPGGPPTNDPVQACLDMTEAVGDAGERCGDDPLATRAAFLDAAAGGSCSNIKSVRDIAALYAKCIPWFGTATCAELTSSTAIPAECRGQLVR